MPNKPETAWCVIPAAGSGSRLGGSLPKQYRDLGGASIIARSVGVFHDMAEVRAVVVGIAEDDAHWSASGLAGLSRLHVCRGGEERAHTVLAGLGFLREELGAAERDWVLIHDAARPLVKPDDVRALLTRCMAEERGGLLAAPMVDTVKRATGAGRVLATEDRATLWRALTPQCFRLCELVAALDEALARGVASTDESAAMEEAGHEVLLVPGSTDNIKITHASDLRLARCLLNS